MAYIDGFNLYYGALKGTKLKWINLKLLSEQLVPSHYQVGKIKYFTARVSGAYDPDSPRRQQLYLSALASIPEVEVIYGNFLSKIVRRPSVNIPIAGRLINSTPPVTLSQGNWPVAFGGGDRILPIGKSSSLGQRPSGQAPVPGPNVVQVEVHTMEEKGSDVNLAVHLLNDAWMDLYDAAVVISNDTDLVTSIRMVARERGKEIFAVAPGKTRLAKKLRDVATFERHIHKSMLIVSQFPERIPGTPVQRPANWA
jgi:uncharacterized LabA/DUF88 family protein